MALAVLCLLTSALQALATPQFTHLGPVEMIENGVVRLEVAPKIGRVVSFRRIGNPEWLQVEDKAPNPGWHWNPWAGDRIWPTPQFLCPQIYGNSGFDPVIDGEPWEVVAKTASSIELRSGVSPRLGIRILRRIELPPGESTAIHSLRIESIGRRKFPVHIWAVTGLRNPEKFFIETDSRIPHFSAKAFRVWLEMTPKTPKVEFWNREQALGIDADTTKKIGTYGRWVAAVRDRELFLQTISFDPKDLYLEASNLQIFTDRTHNTYEMETLSPTWMPGRGGSFKWNIRWDLIELPDKPGSRSSPWALRKILDRFD